MVHKLYCLSSSGLRRNRLKQKTTVSNDKYRVCIYYIVLYSLPVNHFLFEIIRKCQLPKISPFYYSTKTAICLKPTLKCGRAIIDGPSMQHRNFKLSPFLSSWFQSKLLNSPKLISVSPWRDILLSIKRGLLENMNVLRI